MGLKKKTKDENKRSVPVHASLTQELQEVDRCFDNTPLKLHLLEFVAAANGTDQLAAAKQVIRNVEEEENASFRKLAVEILLTTYLDADHKNPIKRTLASGLQTLGKDEYHDTIIEGLVSNVTSLLSVINPKVPARLLINMVASLMDNFSLGEECLHFCYEQILVFLAKQLLNYTLECSTENSPVVQNERMHDCLATLQAFNRLLQKVNSDLVQSVVDNSCLQQALCSVYSAACSVLKNDAYLLDCRSSCGIAITLIIKIAFQNNASLMILDKVFSEKTVGSSPSELSSWMESCLCAAEADLGDLSIGAFLCLSNGLLSIMESADLAHEFLPQQTLLVHALGTKLMKIANGLLDTKSKLMACRTLEAWTRKASLVVKESPNPSLIESLHGNSLICQQLREYAITLWEDPVDAIRHLTRIIFDNVIKLHLAATKEDPRNSVFLGEVLEGILRMSWHIGNRYGALCSLLEVVGVQRLLEARPDFPAHLILVCTHQTTANYASELYEKMFNIHQRALSSVSSDWLIHWQHVWLDPVLKSLCEGTTAQSKHIVEYLVPKLLKKDPENMKFIIEKLTPENKETPFNHISVLVTCLKRARALGIIRADPSGLNENAGNRWSNIVPVIIIKRAVCHSDDQVKLDAFGLLCENFKTTEVIPEIEFEMIRFFLPLNLDNQSPSFRQGVFSFFKKLMVRMKDSEGVLRRRASKQDGDAFISLRRYQEFLTWLSNTLFGSMYPRASFPRRTTVISLLHLLHKFYGDPENNSENSVFYFPRTLDKHAIQALLECLSDTYENNKIEAFSILSSLPEEHLELQREEHLQSLFDSFIQLLSTAKPQHCSTAAYLLKLLLHQPPVMQLLLRHERLSPASDLTPPGLWEDVPTNNTHQTRTRVAMQILLCLLSKQISVAKRSLLHAAATQPLYPTLHCMRYILSDMDFRCVDEAETWSHVMSEAIRLSFEVTAVVSPVTNNSSPEGYMPEHSILGPGLALDAVIESAEDKHLSAACEDSRLLVSAMPEYLIVCCWRSIKEVSLLLGQLTRTLPITEPHAGDNQYSQGLLTVNQVMKIDDFFTTKLLESRHRGAFELAYAGYVEMSHMMWRCKLSAIHDIPKQRLEEVMSDVRSGDADSHLCSTRRSAGVPFYVQAIVSTEPVSTGKLAFHSAMRQLLLLALPPATNTPHPGQVHALNILRGLYRDTRLGEEVLQFIAEGVRAAVDGFSAEQWEIRNSSTLLFSTLMNRIFGVPKSKDDFSRKNCLTSRVFFHRYPSLYQFLLQQLETATKDLGKAGEMLLHPGLYPVLMILGKLFPSSHEGTDSNLSLAAFIPNIIRCADSPVFKTRIMAARALRPLVFKDQLPVYITQLLSSLQKKTNSYNHLHGILLQLIYLLKDMDSTSGSVVQQVIRDALPSIHKTLWLATRDNPCLVVRTAYFEVAMTILCVAQREIPKEETHDLCLFMEEVSREELSQAHQDNASVSPGIEELHKTLARFWMWRIRESRDISTSYEEVLCVLIQSPFYEARVEVLQFIKRVLTNGSRVIKQGTDLDPKIDSTNSYLKSFLCMSQNIFSACLHLLFDKSQHPDCLAEVLSILSSLPKSKQFPWKFGDRVITLLEIERLLMHIRKTSNRNQVQCAVLECYSVLVQLIYEKLVTPQENLSQYHEIYEEWISYIENGSFAEETVTMRLSCAGVLHNSATWLLTDPAKVLGDLPLRMWTVVLRLLQDEDATVREAMSAIVQQYTKSIDSNLYDLGDYADIEWSVAVDVCVGVMVRQHADHRWQAVYNALLGWITDGLHSQHQEQVKDQRLFDKGDLNPLMDEIWFMELVTRHMKRFLSKSCTSLASNSSVGKERTSGQQDLDPARTDGPHQIRTSEMITMQVRNMGITDESDTRPQSNDIYDNKQSSAEQTQIINKSIEMLLRRLISLTLAVKTVTVSNVFVENSDYQNDMVSLHRLLSAITCLCSSSVCTLASCNEGQEQIKKAIESVRSLWADDCVTSSHLHSSIQNMINATSRIKNSQS